MYLKHSCNIMPDSYCKNFSLTNSDSNADEEGISKHKSCIEIRGFFPIIPKSLMFNSRPARIKITLCRFHSYQAVLG